MMYITCRHCGDRNEDEFVFGGDTSKHRPASPDQLSNQSWCDYIYTVPNVKGVALEYWWHKRGCNCWITVQRDTRTDEIHSLAKDALRDKSISP